MRLPQLEIKNRLVNVGEEIQLEILAEADTPLSLVIEENYLEDSSPRTQEVPLDWQAANCSGIRRSEATYRVARPGNYLARLQGPEGELPSRYFAAARPGLSVCYPFLNGASFGTEPGAFFGEEARGYQAKLYEEIVHCVPIPFDYQVGGRFIEENRDLFAPFARFEYLYGDTIIPMATANNFGFDHRFNLWEFTEEETVEAIENLKGLWEEWGFRSLEVLNIHWCMGNVTMRAARTCGLKVLAALVGNYYMRDGESREIATGSPLRPYFMHQEDFRKAGPLTEDALLCLLFSVVIPTNFHRGNVDAHWASDIQMVWDRSIESGTQGYRSAEILDSLCEQPVGEAPFCFPLSVQNFGPPAVYENNCNALRYALQKAREGKLVFTNARGLREYYTEHFREHPETVSYTRDFMVGSWLIDKPIHHPDVLQIENSHLHAAFNRGDNLPDYFYNYDRPWDYPDEIFRDLTKFGPEPEQTEGVEVGTRWQETEAGARLTVQISSDRDFDRLPVAVWEVPYRLAEGEIEVVTASPGATEDLRFIPVQAPLEQSQHALLVGPVQQGDNTWEFDLRCPRYQYTPHLQSYHNLVGIKTIPNPGRVPYTYVWCQLPGETVVRLAVPPGREAWGEYYDGSHARAAGGDVVLRLNWPRPWARVWNVSADELRVANGQELDVKAAQVLADTLRRYPLEDKTEAEDLLRGAQRELLDLTQPREQGEYLSRLVAANRDYQNRYLRTHWRDLLQQRQRWFEKMTAHREVHQVLVAAHAYLKGHLGGPWRDRADLDNVMEMVPGVEFSLPVYDYAVAWEPGHSAWHMGRAFTMRLRGLSAYQGMKVIMYLHGSDYDCLGRAYAVRLVAKEIAGGRPVEVHRVWILPPGPEGRDQPGSLLPVPIPQEYLALAQFDIHVLEGYLAHGMDMRKQVPYSVAISDVWVTEEA